VLFTRYDLGDQIKDSDIGRACGMYGYKEKCRALAENLQVRDYSEDLGVDKKAILI